MEDILDKAFGLEVICSSWITWQGPWHFGHSVIIADIKIGKYLLAVKQKIICLASAKLNWCSPWNRYLFR